MRFNLTDSSSKENSHFSSSIANLLLVALLSLSLISCGRDQQTTPPQPPQTEVTEKTTPPEITKPLETLKSPDAMTTEPEQPPAEPPKKPSIAGVATIHFKIDSQPRPIADLELVLCPTDIEPELKAARDQGWIRKANIKRYDDGYNNLDLRSIGIVAVRNAIDEENGRAKANLQGEYAFYDIDAGNYLIYAQFKGKYTVGYWLLPVEVKDGETTKQDVHTENFKEVYNWKKY